ncbi:MAG: acetylxylan esterase, partial [Puniceicoccales bacterium]
RTIELKIPDHQVKCEALESKGVKGVNVEIPCLDVKPVRGYYATPGKASAGGHPAIIVFHAAGVKGGWCRSSLINTMGLADKYNAIVIDINAHGMLNGQPQTYYDELEAGELANYRYQDNDNRDTFYFLGMYLRLMRAIDFLCAQPEWDGHNLIAYGISQGGAQSLAAAGLDSRVSTSIAIVPALCNISTPNGGWPGMGKTSPDTEEGKRVLETYRYFDSVNFCALTQANVLIAVGLIDTTCPPPGVLTAYNQIQSNKQLLSAPDESHHGMSTPNSAQRKTYDAFMTENIKQAP